MNTSTNPFTRGISGVTKGPRDLSVPRETPTGQEGIYQLGALFQLSDAQAGMFCNIRRASVYAGDLEMGSDLVMFDDLNVIPSPGSASGLAVIRSIPARSGDSVCASRTSSTTRYPSRSKSAFQRAGLCSIAVALQEAAQRR